MSSEKIGTGDIVKHKDKDVEMLVIGRRGHWVTCEYANSDGERVEKTFDQEFLVIVQKKPPLKINPNALKMSF
ncbi:hypothetical protein [Acinetobacter sp. WU_MDCI_Abxb74]|uniref:hypothetical protein n=1 Tax=Acinetobacter sp. WU_MDCI_Abxb74 TaxID=2850072 RepID=UPI0021CD6C7E|nr:hypothetical protein [Acinetobacter sp. WU_MDCI_Abxb74]MCU4423212.1 hypothetical protein [Acinetobacter sp. WU_MDCI_Abxb74]